MPKYKEVVKQKEFKKKRQDSHLRLVEERTHIKNFFKVVYGVGK